MVKTILGEAFEQLGEIPKQVVKQTAKLPTDIVGGAVKSVVGGQRKKVDPLTGIEIPSPTRVKKLKREEKKMKITVLSQARQVISQVKPVSRSPAQIPLPKEKLPPPVSASKPKWGTAERKLGING